MKINLLSDLHLEFADFEITNNSNADVLILSGDICVAAHMNKGPDSPYFEKGQKYIDFFERASSLYPKIFYTPGNHEHYQGRFDKTLGILHEKLGHIENLSILYRTSEEYKGFLFYGATLWTDLSNPVYEATVRAALNDYRLIQIEKHGVFRKLHPMDTTQEHFKTLEDLKTLQAPKIVMIGHHAPCGLSIEEKYKGHPTNPGYYTNLIAYTRPEIVLWTHGHVHCSNDYLLNVTRVVSNPRGYNDENKDFQKEYIISLDN